MSRYLVLGKKAAGSGRAEWLEPSKYAGNGDLKKREVSEGLLL